MIFLYTRVADKRSEGCSLISMQWRLRNNRTGADGMKFSRERRNFNDNRKDLKARKVTDIIFNEIRIEILHGS